MFFLDSNTGGIIIRLKNGVNEFISDELDRVIEVSQDMGEGFKYLAFIGVLIRIFYNYRDNPTYYWGYLDWIPLAGFLFNYHALAGAIMGFSNAFDNMNTSEQILNLSSSFFQEAKVNKQTEEVSIFDMGASYIYHIVKMAFLETLCYIFLMLGYIASGCWFVYFKFKILLKMVVLLLFGPINISLSFLPSFSGGWKGWLQNVIEIGLYIPLLAIVDYIGLGVMKKVFQPTIIKDASDVGADMGNSLLGIIFYVLLLASYFSITKAVAYGMARGSSIGGGQKVKAMAMMLARKAITGI